MQRRNCTFHCFVVCFVKQPKRRPDALLSRRRSLRVSSCGHQHAMRRCVRLTCLTRHTSESSRHRSHRKPFRQKQILKTATPVRCPSGGWIRMRRYATMANVLHMHIGCLTFFWLSDTYIPVIHVRSLVCFGRQEKMYNTSCIKCRFSMLSFLLMLNQQVTTI